MDRSAAGGGAVLSWSGGKDAAMALHERRDAVGRLLTTVSAATGRSSMHGVRPALHTAQAAALDLPITFVEVPGDGTNESYERAMREEFERAANEGAESLLFADLFLEDVRAYREDLVDTVDLHADWPLWQRDTEALMEAFLRAGFRAVIVVVDGDALPPTWLGRELTAELVDDLPETVDPCGEHGEFHTFVFDGPPFDHPISMRFGRRITRVLGESNYHFLDLLPS